MALAHHLVAEATPSATAVVTVPVKGSSIPLSSRVAVQERARGRCERCGGRGAQWHHRRRRAVKDEHRHEPCNGLWLCATCHHWAHAHPIDAKLEGVILPSVTSDPSAVPVTTIWGRRRLTCDGRYASEKGEQDVLHG